MSPSISVAVVGATGYGGAELVHLLHNHPSFSLEYLTSQSYSGERFSSVHPRFQQEIDLICESLSIDRIQNHDLAFFALPHGKSMEFIPSLDRSKTAVVDLAADYRLSSAEEYEQVYEEEHIDTAGLKDAVYGLTEYYQDSIGEADLVACPGCYVTASLIPLIPIFETMSDINSFFIDAKSGISGAGRKPTTSNTFVNCNDNIKPYKVASHRHSAEIQQTLNVVSDNEVEFSFVPHVNAMDHGIESAIYVECNSHKESLTIKNRLEKLCDENYFFRYFTEPPGVKNVVKTPYCDISVTIDDNRAIVFSNLDNLWKGAASQAIQNANLMFGLDLTTGLV